MKVEKFEDLIAWQKAGELTKKIYQSTRQEPFCRDFGLANQIQRSAVSVMSNLAEGFERGSSSEFHQFIVRMGSDLHNFLNLLTKADLQPL